MSEETARIDPHESVWGSIPWFVNGRLSDAEATQVEAHLKECERCRAECALQAKLHDAIREDDSMAFTSEASYRKLAYRIDSSAPRRAFVGTRRAVLWLAAALAVESVALVAWGAWSWSSNREPSARYVTLSSAPTEVSRAANAAQVRIVFLGSATLADVEGLLRGVGARVVDGPTERGVYTVQLNKAESASSGLSVLKASPLVRLAEPVFVEADLPK